MGKPSSPQPPLTPARQQLQQALASLAAADKAAQAAREPIANLRHLITEKQQALAALDQQAKADLTTFAAQVEAWATSGASGPMPSADAHIAAGRADRDAAEALRLEVQGLEAAVAKLLPAEASAATKVAGACARVKAAIKDVVLEQAVVALNSRSEAILAFRTHTAELAAIRAWLIRERDSAGEAEAIRRKIDDVIADPSGEQLNEQVARWRAFADALTTNPAAQP